MRFNHNPISEARKLVPQFRKQLGEAPEVKGLCQKKDNCDICRKARKASKIYMAYIYTGWDIDAITRLCETYSDMESRIYGKDENIRLESLYKSFGGQIDKICQNINKSLNEYLSLLNV
jgi:hypothetical protein